MLAKLTSKNQLTLPKAATEAVGATEYFDVETRNGVIILTPVRIQRGDAVRAKLAELALHESDIGDAVAWARKRVAEPRAGYAAKAAPTKRTPAKPARKPGKRSGKA
ncbi:MAG TPA: hypothetical protein VHF02_07110 [Luteimonas sp.]|nr:hypothetical protein [Luteimonas sp.]